MEYEFKFKKLNEIYWFIQLYYANIGKNEEDKTLTSIWKAIWGTKRHMGQYEFLQKLVDAGVLVKKGEVRIIGKYFPWYEVDKDKMEEIFMRTKIFKFAEEIVEKNRVVL